MSDFHTHSDGTVDEYWLPSISAITDERIEQVRDRGFTAEHDDHHSPDDLIAAGLCYAEWALWDLEGSSGDSPPFNWPWDSESWHPEESALENIVKAGALLAAGYDRILRDIKGDSNG